MALSVSIVCKTFNIKKMHIEKAEYVTDTKQKNNEEYVRDYINLHVRPYKREQCHCPVCGKKCSCYDHQMENESSWRGPDCNGVPTYIMYRPARIICPEHGILTEALPWADGKSRFTPDFNNEVAFMALTCPKTVVAQYFGIDWRTVGNCIKAVHDRLEPDVTIRLHCGLKRICVDETAIHKGHKYITVVYDMDRNRVIWVHEGFGLEVFRKFCEALTEEERQAIKVVAGDGARWIDKCTEEYFTNAKRCIDFFHVVGWANECLDKVRNSARTKAVNEVVQMKKEFQKIEDAEKEEVWKIKNEIKKTQKELKMLPKRGRPSKHKKELETYIKELEKQLDSYKKQPEVKVSKEEYKAAVKELESMPRRGRRSQRKAELLTITALYEKKEKDPSCNDLSSAQKKVIDELNQKVKNIKGTKYALGMNPENLSKSSQDKLKLIEASYPDVYKAYQMKEELRAILHMKDAATAEIALDQWIKAAIEDDIKQFKELAEKIKRHRNNILNSIKLQVNSSKSEATNTTIKSLIATARGFRNIDNLFALIYLRCSDLVIPLHNRYQPSPEKQQELRELQNKRKQTREEAKRASLATA